MGWSGIFSRRTRHLNRNTDQKGLGRKEQVQKLDFFKKWNESRASCRIAGTIQRGSKQSGQVGT